MIFNTLWTILLGVIGGIVSSLIVSKVFLIQSEYQIQVRLVDGIIRKIGYISAFLQSMKAIFEVSYDQDVTTKKEMKEKGYHCEMEYYAAHADKKWISVDDTLNVFRKEIEKVIKSIHDDIRDNTIKDEQLNKLISDILTYINEVSSVKEFTFSQISQLKGEEQKLIDQYESCLHMSGKKLISLVLKDRVMIALFIVVTLLIAGTIVAFSYGV